MKRVAAVLAMVLAASTAMAQWQTRKTTDAMTDKVVTEAFVTNDQGDRFTVLRRDDGSVWGFLKLGGARQFSVGDRLLFRVDDLDVKTFDEGMNETMRRIGMNLKFWEWNPDLIAFRMWHGKRNEGCGMVQEIYYGKRLVIRYHPNESTIRDVVFPMKGSGAAMDAVAGFDIRTCPGAPRTPGDNALPPTKESSAPAPLRAPSNPPAVPVTGRGDVDCSDTAIKRLLERGVQRDHITYACGVFEEYPAGTIRR